MHFSRFRSFFFFFCINTEKQLFFCVCWKGAHGAVPVNSWNKQNTQNKRTTAERRAGVCFHIRQPIWVFWGGWRTTWGSHQDRAASCFVRSATWVHRLGSFFFSLCLSAYAQWGAKSHSVRRLQDEWAANLICTRVILRVAPIHFITERILIRRSGHIMYVLTRPYAVECALQQELILKNK